MIHPGLNGGNLNSGTNSAVPSSGQQGAGLHSSSQDPGLSPHLQHSVSARPVFYIHAPPPPPPPFLYYQWPMPLSYNPFAGFPGMGCGMIMPPFPPPSYMEAPTYILPQHHIQAVDYRRLLQPQVYAPSEAYQNSNQTRRVRPPHTVPTRQTVNSEVQTETTHRDGGGSLIASSDSGHGTASNSPSSISTSQKPDSAEVENDPITRNNAEDFQVDGSSTRGTVKHSTNIPHSAGMKTVQSCIRATLEAQKCCKDSVDQENIPPCRNGHCNMWSVSSPESIVPVCSSSQQENEVVKERCVSISDILKSWGVGTPQAMILKMADKVLPQNDLQLPSSEPELEHEQLVYQSLPEIQNDQVVAGSRNDDDAMGNLSSKDSKTLFKILKLPFALYDVLSDSRGDNENLELDGSLRLCLPYRDELLHSLNKSHEIPENGNERTLQEGSTEILPCQISLNSCQMMRKINESVWSVESVAPFIPSKEWLLQNGIFEPEVIEMTEEAKNCSHSTQNDNPVVEASRMRQTCRFSASESVPMSDSCLIFSTPAEKLSPPKKPERESEITGPKLGQSMTPSEKNPLASSTCLQSKVIVSSPIAENVDGNGSSEPEANQSPNQEFLHVNVQQEKSSCFPEQEASLCLSSEGGKDKSDHATVQNGVDTEVDNGACWNKEVGHLSNEQLCVRVAKRKMAEVSPSKGHLVDFGVQCTRLQEWNCFCNELNGSMGINRGDGFKHSDMKKANNGHMQKNQKRHGQWKNRGYAEKHISQMEAYEGNCGKPWKFKGGNGRNPRHSTD